MRMCDHPNVLSCYASFVHENELWLVMEFMSKGSCLHIMNVAKKEVKTSIDNMHFVSSTLFRYLQEVSASHQRRIVSILMHNLAS